MGMVTVHMAVQVSKRATLFLRGFILGFFVFIQSVSAATYSSGLYGAGLYSGTDIVAPVISNGAPSGVLQKGTENVSLTVDTDENSTCRYSIVAGTAYGSMTTTFTTSGGLHHSTPVTGLRNGSEYSYYVRCIDAYSNATTSDYLISFTVSSKSGEVIGKVGPLTPIPVEPSVPVISGCTSFTIFSPVTGQRCPVVTTPSSPSTSTGSTTPVFFTNNLSAGMRTEDVKKLQQYLNTHGSIVASVGPGSLGNETIYFGPATKAAVVKFQIANGIKPSIGFFGPLTRTFVNNKEKGL
jgi:hypothetical protein